MVVLLFVAEETCLQWHCPATVRVCRHNQTTWFSQAELYSLLLKNKESRPKIVYFFSQDIFHRYETT
jgi:hypothetical protein